MGALQALFHSSSNNMAQKLVGLCGAVAGGIATVSIGGGVLTGEGKDPFSLTGERYDQKTFQGRFFKMLTNTNPALLPPREPEIRAAEAELKLYKEGKSTKTDAELWDL